MKQFLVVSLFITLLFACNNAKKDDLLEKSTGNGDAFSGGQSTNSSGKQSFDTAKGKYSLTVKFTPFIPEYPDLGESGKKLLTTRLNAAVSKIGYGGDGANPRFIIGTDINLLSKNVTSTSPTKYANTYEVTLLTCDVVTETVFNSYSFQVKGVGDSPEKSFINAFRDYKLENEEFFKFLMESQKKILAFYDQNCEKFLQEADAEAKMRKFDAAFTVLSNIPIDAVLCYAKIMAKKSEYFQMNLNVDCQLLLSSMKAEMGKANDPSASGFNEEAMTYYQMIDKQSSCFKEAESVYQSYLKKLNPKAKRDWEFQMQKYQDNVKKLEKNDQFKRDSTMENFSYLKHKEEMKAKAEVEGNKKLLQKYQYDELPWLRKQFHLGKYDPFDRIEK